MRRMLRRLQTMSGAEVRFRAEGSLRRHAQRLRVAAGGAGWDRRRIGQALAEDAGGELLDAAARADWPAAEERLRARIRERPSRFLLDIRTSDALRARVTAQWPSAPGDAAAAAEAIAAGRFALLGFDNLSFTREPGFIDWHYDPVHDRRMPRRFWADVPYLEPRFGDHKIVWELNRHQHFLPLGRAYWLTGDPRHGGVIVDHVSSWMHGNPPLVGVNWASALELALRSLSWVWALHVLLADVPLTTDGRAGWQRSDITWCLDMLLGLDRQLTHVEQNLSRYFSPNTHLTGEALALYVAGSALPELRCSGRWRALGREILLREIDRQICADGGHAERSTHYHRYTLDIYLCALIIAERTGDAAAAGTFRPVVARLATFMEALADGRGWIPLIGDDDGGMLWPIAGRDPRDVRDSLALARVLAPGAAAGAWAMPEEVLWLAGPAVERAAAHAPDRPVQPGAIVFPDTGFVVMRTGGGDHLTFDVGPHGYLNGGHAHADALSVTLTVAGQPLLVDPGTVTYTMDRAVRDAMRHSARHNTLTLDGRSSAVSLGPFHWRSRADATLHAWQTAREFAFAEAAHDGYTPLAHRRLVVQSPGGGWLILDEVIGEGRHSAELHWLFDPSWDVEPDGSQLRATSGDRRIWLLHDGGDLTVARGDAARDLGWCSPRYGVRIPCWAAASARTVTAPATLATWIGAAGGTRAPSLDRVRITADAGARAAAVRVQCADRAIVALLRPGDASRRIGRTTDCPDYHTDGRVLHYVSGAGSLEVSLADGSHAIALHDALISLSGDTHLGAVHVQLAGERLEVWCPSPPPVLHLQGRPLGVVQTVTLNGRERGVAGAAREGAVTCAACDWGSADACSPTAERFERRAHPHGPIRIVREAGDRRLA